MPHGADEATNMTAHRTTLIQGSLLRGGIVACGLWLAVGGASAQEAGFVADAAPERAMSLSRLFDSFELAHMPSAGINQGPRRALRIRLEGTTEAVRSLGLAASYCAPYLRSTNGARRVLGTGLPGGDIRGGAGLSLALNCSF